MPQVLGRDIIPDLTWVSNTQVSLVGPMTITIGGQQFPFAGTLFCSTATTGAGGLDTGTVAANTNYHVYIVSNFGVPALVMSMSLVAPVGFSIFRYIWTVHTDGSINVLKFIKSGKTNYFVNVNRGVDGNTRLLIDNLTPAAGDDVISSSNINTSNLYISISNLILINLRIIGNSGTPAENYGAITVLGNSDYISDAVLSSSWARQESATEHGGGAQGWLTVNNGVTYQIESSFTGSSVRIVTTFCEGYVNKLVNY